MSAMNYHELGFWFGVFLTHAGAFVAGLWLRDRAWKGIVRRAGL